MGDLNMDGFGGNLVFFGVFVLLFLIGRAIVLWYWRVNETVELLKSIDEKLGVLAANAPGTADPNAMRAGLR
jgi:hypothetical protein